MQLEAAFFNAWGPEEHKVMSIGAMVCQIFEGPGLHQLDSESWMQSVAYAQCAIETKMPAGFHRFEHHQSLTQGPDLKSEKC